MKSLLQNWLEKSLSNKLTFQFMLSYALIFILFSVILLAEIESDHQYEEQWTQQTIDIINEDLVRVSIFENMEDVATITEKLDSIDTLQTLTLLNLKNENLFTYQKMPVTSYAELKTPTNLKTTQFIESASMLEAWHPVKKENVVLATAYIQFSHEKFNKKIQLLALGGMFFLLLIIIIGYLSRKTIKVNVINPIELLGKHLQDIVKTGNYSNKIDGDSSAELTVLYKEFNQMMSELNQLKNNLETRINERTQELILAKHNAEKANRTKSEFLSSMSHELRTPLNSILGFAQLLELNSHITDEDKAFVTPIRISGEHLLALVNDILDLAKIEAGDLDINLTPISIGAAIHSALTLVQPIAEKHSVTVNAKFLNDDIVVAADDVRFKQVLFNLLSNAIKYNVKNGRVSIEMEPTDNHIHISVKDTGVGLTEQEIEHLFVPFDRLGAEGGHIEGTGIGMVITKTLIERMHGELKVESQKGVGSCFTIILPRH